MAQELKAGVIVTPHDEVMCFNRGSDVIAVTERETEFYIKSEADKVLLHHARKRCLAMANACDLDALYSNLQMSFVVAKAKQPKLLRHWSRMRKCISAGSPSPPSLRGSGSCSSFTRR